MTTTPPSVEPPGWRPPPDPPELPEGVEPTPGRPAWPPWSSFVALLAAFGGALGGGLVVGIFATIAGADITDPPPAVNIVSLVVQDGCFIGAAVIFARMTAAVRPWQFGLRPTEPRRALASVVVVYLSFIAFSAAWVAALGIDEQDDLPDSLGVNQSTVALIAVAFLVTVVAPIAEEFFFRGYFFPALRNWRGVWPAAAITGLVFGAIHAGSAPVGYLVPLGVFGMALCLLYVRTGSLYPCIALHCLNNSIAFGTTVDWGWQIPLLLAGALATIALAAYAVRARFGPAPPVPSPV
jgi:membrane protease YdiL (CAAX protease family)